MTIRVEKRQSFAIVDSRTVNDERLSMRARGVLVWLLDKPDGWRVNADAIARQAIEGRDAIRTALKELEECGYLRRVRSQDEKGRWVTESVVSELPDRERDPRARSDAWESDVGETDAGSSGPDTSTQRQDPEPVPMSPASPPDTPTPQVKPAVAALEKLPKAVDAEDVKALCIHLRERIGAHHPTGGKPTVSPAWVRDMGTLLNSGPQGWEGHVPSPMEVRGLVDLIFANLATPDGKGFCWANQVRSPGALRRHWKAVESALAAQARAGAGTASDAATVAENAARLREVMGR